jgi:MFS family permease
VSASLGRLRTVRTYRELFGVGEFRVLFVSTCLNVAAGSVSSLALGTLTYAETRSPLLSAFAMFGGPLVRLVSSWLLLSLSDLWRPRTSLMVAAGGLAAANAVQAIPGLSWQARFVVLLLPWVLLSATGGSLMALVSEILPEGAFVLGRSTLNIAVGVMQIAGYGAAGLLLLALDTGQLFAGAAGAGVLTALLVRLGLRDRPPRAVGTAISRSRAVNRLVLGSPVVRPVYLALWVPNGLVVGCEALFVPYGGRHAGFLFSAAAAGMLVGDIGMGRFVPAPLRDRLVEPARLLLATPYLAFFLHPGLPAACALSLVASVGYCASLPLQERLLTRTAPDVRGHVLGLNSLGMMSMQGLGALAAGAVATLLGAGADAAAVSIGLMAVASVVVTLSLVPGLRRSRDGHGLEVLALDVPGTPDSVTT